MRSRSCVNAESRPRAFTLVELLAVVVVVALMAGLLASSALATGPERRARSSIRELTTMLSTTRIQAMRMQQEQACEVRIDGDRMIAEMRERQARTWSSAGLSFAGGEEFQAVLFAPDGRASDRQWSFAPTHGAARAWMIEFHPLSGAPRASDLTKEQPS